MPDGPEKPDEDDEDDDDEEDDDLRDVVADHEKRLTKVEKRMKGLAVDVKETRLLTRALVMREGMDPKRIVDGAKANPGDDSLKLELRGSSVKWFIRVLVTLIAGGLAGTGIGKLLGWL